MRAQGDHLEPSDEVPDNMATSTMALGCAPASSRGLLLPSLQLTYLLKKPKSWVISDYCHCCIIFISPSGIQMDLSPFPCVVHVWRATKKTE